MKKRTAHYDKMPICFALSAKMEVCGKNCPIDYYTSSRTLKMTLK